MYYLYYMYLKRYVPELQALCAKKLAEMCRSMTQKERYDYMKLISIHIKELINSFPINVIEWYKNEHLLNIKIINHYVKHKEDIHYLVKGFNDDCNKGITRKKVIFRKCQNVYCDDTVLQKIIQSPCDIYWGLCKKCEQYRIPHHKLMKLRLQIQSNKIE